MSDITWWSVIQKEIISWSWITRHFSSKPLTAAGIYVSLLKLVSITSQYDDLRHCLSGKALFSSDCHASPMTRFTEYPIRCSVEGILSVPLTHIFNAALGLLQIQGQPPPLSLCGRIHQMWTLMGNYIQMAASRNRNVSSAVYCYFEPCQIQLCTHKGQSLRHVYVVWYACLLPGSQISVLTFINFSNSMYIQYNIILNTARHWILYYIVALYSHTL